MTFSAAPRPGLQPDATDPPREANGAAAPPRTAAAPPIDLALGAFSDNPPWLVDPARMPWRRAIDTVRWASRRSVPRLVTPRRLPPGGRLVTVLRHLVPAIGLWYAGARRRGGADSRADLSRRLRIAAEHLGPTYIKLAQIISSGQGLFPEELVRVCQRCRDQVPPEPWAEVRQVIEDDLRRPLEAVFAWIDHEPLASASIAQVHAARLHSGEEVVVKVQRPTVARRVSADIQVMAWVAPFLVGRIPVAALANPPALVELFAETITEELDFRLEAQNMLDVARVFAELGQRRYVVPRPHPTLVTPRVLVMERLDGFAFYDVEGMKAAGVDTHAVVRTGMVGFMEGALLHGIFHGDLHGGNLFVLPDSRVALLDFGITGRLDETRRRAFLRLLITSTTSDLRGQLAALRDLGALPPDVDLEAVIRDLDLEGDPIDARTTSQEEMVTIMQETVKQLLAYGARLPKELMLFIKNLVFIDGAIATLAPDLDLFAEITQISLYFATTHGERIAADVGIDPRKEAVDLTGFKGSLMVGAEEESSLTYRELQRRRELIRERMEATDQRRARRRRRPRWPDRLRRTRGS
jgi:ubiquinone biosynthesis protein